LKPLSAITELFTESVIREMTRVCDEVKGYNLAQGFPDFEAPAQVKRAALAAIERNLNQYPVTFGQPALRQAIARRVKAYNAIEADPATDVTVTCGATEAMIASLKAILNPGDEIIVFEPFYENYGPDAILSGARPRYVTLRPPEWSFDPDELAAAFNDRTKAVILNTPHNPTGKVFSRQELSLIAGLCQKWDAYTVSDEVYEHILYDGAEHVSIASLPGMAERAVTINSMSKTYSVTGWRVGWAVACPAITARIRKVHDFLTVGAPTPFQEAGVVALGLPEAYYQELGRRYAHCREMFYALLERTGFRPYKPRGAYYIMTEVAQLMDRLGAADDDAFARNLVRMTGVAVVPGTSFYATPGLGREQVRFCFAKSQATLDAVAERLTRLAG